MSARIRRYKILLLTLLQLGMMSIARVVLYRCLLKLGYYKKTLKIREFNQEGHFFSGLSAPPPKKDIQSSQAIISCADSLINGELELFSHFHCHFQGMPDWFYDPLSDKTHCNTEHWTSLNEFGFESSDVKILWETSRFSWAPILAQAFVLTKDFTYLDTLNAWIEDWCTKNPANQGIQWKCGQETSLRLLHFLTTLRLLGEHENPQTRCLEFVERHLERIAPTTFYAQAQRNNHLTSEGAALYIAGYWLSQQKSVSGKRKRIALKYHNKGKRLLEWASSSLIYSDGSFAQHSVVYHRIMLDTFSVCEIWRKHFDLPKFSEKLIDKLQKATDWMFWFTDAISGDAPNLGGNDGAHVFNLGLDEYRDFRPSVQLASMHFYGECYYPQGKWDEQLKWLSDARLVLKYNPKQKVSKLFPQGGYYIHVSEQPDLYWFMFRLPYYKDRPAHSDAMHFDLWSNGKNLLRDSGSYSYSVGDKITLSNLKGVAGHNSVQFDNYDQMPVLGRFLFGCWLRGKWSITNANENQVISASYIDQRKHAHTRIIQVKNNEIKIIDDLYSRQSKFTLRWHLGQWPLSNCNLTINSDNTIDTQDKDLSQFSLKYLKMENGNCITAKGFIENYTRIVTRIHFK